jgi:hypothetical protein
VKHSVASAVLSRILASAGLMIWTVVNMKRSAKNMKLIDADKLKEAINSSLNTGRETFSPEIIREAIDEQPTAFDVDKVVGELKRDKFIESECILSDVHQGYNAGLSRAVEIVKGGGVE